MASGLYVKLDASYEDDEKIIQAGEKAELLYVRSLCLVKRILSDGFIADAHLPRFGLSAVNQRARKLCEVGLWDRDDERGGYWIRAWPKHNRSAADVKAQQTKAQQDAVLGNHRRWHQDTPSPDCPHCYTDPDPPPDSPPESGTRSGSLSPETETETETETLPEAQTTPVGGDPPTNGHDTRRLAHRWRDYARDELGLSLPEPERTSERFRAVFEVMLDEVPAHDRHGQVIGFVCDYIEVATGEEHKVAGGERSFLARVVNEFPPLRVFDAAVEGVTWGAGTGDYADHPSAVVSYMRSVLGKGAAA